jgi:exonuclease SbcC
LFEIQSDKASDHLEQFFSSNLEDVSDVFRTIHMPNEFARLEYDNHLELITKTGKRRALTEISTGQRSALALSIFISLNRRLRRGPDILMFDDPVANVDDLNLLSFLDFLRLFIVKEQKQIFFATSNTRVSALFKRKFDFLGDDFKFWELYRMD